MSVSRNIPRSLFLVFIFVVGLGTPVESVAINGGYLRLLKCLGSDRVQMEVRPWVAASERCDSSRERVADQNWARLARLGGMAAIYDDRPGDAIRLFREAISLNEGNTFSYWGLGRAYEGMGNYRAAISNMEKANNEDYVLEVLESRSGAGVDVEAFAKAAIEANVHAAEAQLFLGRRLISRDPGKAIEYLTASSQNASLSETSSEAYYLLGTLVYAQDAALAESHFRNSIVSDDRKLERYYEIATFYLNEANSEVDAWRWVNEMEDAFPEASLTHDLLGWLYWQAGERELALEHYEKAVTETDDSIRPWSYGRYGNINMSMGRYVDAIDNYRSALELTENGSVPLTIHLVEAYLALEDCANAQEVARRLLPADADHDTVPPSAIENLRQKLEGVCGASG